MLGCTHYVAVLDILKKVLPQTEFFSGENRVAGLLYDIKGEERPNCQAQMFVSKENDFLPKLLCYFNKKSEM